MASFEFLAAIRGFHVYRQNWQPEENERLICSHESDNSFDLFAIKTINQRGILTGHLPREISRPTKYLLDRGAMIKATLTDNRYRRSPIFQGGLEIPCKVTVELPKSQHVNQLINRYQEMVSKLYVEPETPVIEGTFLNNDAEPIPHQTTETTRTKKGKSSSASNMHRGPGIMFYLKPGSTTYFQKPKNKPIEIDSD